MPCHTPPEPPTHLPCPERKVPEHEEKPASLIDALPEVVIQGGMTGADTTVTINGKRIDYLDAVRFETVAGQLSRVTVTFTPKSVSICTLGEVMAYERELTPSNLHGNDDGINRFDFYVSAHDRMYKQTMTKFNRLSALMKEVETLMRELDPTRMKLELCVDEGQRGGEHGDIQ